MRIAVALLAVVVATSGCASWDKSETVVAEIGRVPVEEAIGLSRVELEKRLGLTPAKEPTLLSAWLEDGALMQRVGMYDMAQQQRCPSGRFPEVGFERAGKTWGIPNLFYRDGKLSGLGDDKRIGDDPTQPAFLKATCETYRRAGKDTATDVTMIALSAPILLPIGAALHGINAIGSIGSPDMNAGLAQLPLGAEPPGGLDAYLAKLPPGARLVSREANMVRIEFCRRKCEDRSVDRAAGAVFVDGRVVRLDGGKCVLTVERTFKCAP